MNPSIAKKTQETLGKVIKKPPLTDKLLSKPPFRFLHDIITEVIRNTGVLKGLYTADEMNSANVKEKDAKIAFLQKAIDVVAILSGVSLSVRPSKIVAGHEPEKTNEFLQELAKTVTAKKNSSDAVKTVLSGGKPGKSAGDGKRKERSKSRDREISKEKDPEKKSDSGSANKETKRKESAHGSGEERKRREDSSRKEDSGRREDSAKRERGRDRERERKNEQEKEKEIPKEKTLQKDVDGADTVDTGLIDGNVEETEFQQNRIPRPSSAKGQRRRHDDGEALDSHGGDDGLIGTDSAATSKEQMNGVLHEDELPQQVIQSRRMARPSSARPAPPKIKKQQEELEDQNARIGSGKQVTSVIVDNGKDDDDDETFVVEDNHPMTNDIDAVPSNESIEDESGHGGLVRKILETTKELEGSKEQTSKSIQDKSIISDAARQKERQLAQKEIEKLRGSIQTLTRSANPLGKIMDYIQEDVDSMNKELEMWRTENRDHSIALKREQSITDNEIEPLQSQLDELESEITEMVDRISTVKCNILKNEEKIHQMLSSISFNSR